MLYVAAEFDSAWIFNNRPVCIRELQLGVQLKNSYRKFTVAFNAIGFPLSVILHATFISSAPTLLSTRSVIFELFMDFLTKQ